MAEDKKKGESIPSWQQAASTNDEKSKPEAEGNTSSTKDDPTEEVLDVAREFLKDEAVRSAPHEEKVDFLKEKGLSPEAIEKLLAETQIPSDELKTVHDTTQKAGPKQQDASTAATSVAQPATGVEPEPAPEPKPEVAPIITYPEFLLKPQKPPPLITVSRLKDAAYAIAGVSALTWGASKYIFEPMLHTLTEARHELADTTLQDLEKLNEKLEGTVSHVPYIASSKTKRAQEHEEDARSVDSDPTELFHRDTATQTSPGLSRTSSETSLTRHTLDPTIAQSERLAGLSYSLKSLLQSVEHSTDNEKHLHNTIQGFQKQLDTLESSYSFLRNDYYGSSSIYSSAASDAKKATTRENEAQKFKQEIRALKGAFLSSRNFPTAPRPSEAARGQVAR